MNAMKKSKLGFDLDAGEVDVNAPLIYLIEIVDKATGVPKVVYVGKSEKGAKRPFQRYDLGRWESLDQTQTIA